MTVDETVRFVVTALEDLTVDYAIGGSFASGTWGEPRTTNDLDLVLNLRRADLQAFTNVFEPHFAIGSDALSEALESSDPYRGSYMTSYDSAFQVDIFLLNRSPYDLEEFARRTRRTLLPGLDAWIFSAEDTILRKLAWYESGNRRSDKQWNDVQQILHVRQGLLDENYLAHWAPELGVAELLQQAVAEQIESEPEK